MGEEEFSDSGGMNRILVLRSIPESRMAVGGGNGPGIGTQEIFRYRLLLADCNESIPMEQPDETITNWSLFADCK
jgi:hypothetical protein